LFFPKPLLSEAIIHFFDNRIMENLDTTPEKKRRGGFDKFIRWAGGITIALIFIIGLANNSSSSTSSSSAATPTITPAVPANPIAAACQDYASSTNQTISYKQLEKDPASFQEQSTTFTGQVLQIQESNGQGYLRLAVDKASYGWNLNDIVLVQYDGHNDAVQDDIISVSGILKGSQTYTSQANFQITVPLMYGCSIQKRGVKAATSIPAKATSVSASPQTTAPISTPPAQTTYTTPNGAVLNSEGQVVTPAPAAPASWHTAYTYNASVTTKTPAFALQGQQQKISYTCSVADSGNTYSNFNGVINSTANYSNDVFAWTVNCPSSNSTYEYSLPSGQYYLDLTSGNSSYTVTVQDYY
jgi:hypothetical protein